MQEIRNLFSKPIAAAPIMAVGWVIFTLFFLYLAASQIQGYEQSLGGYILAVVIFFPLLALATGLTSSRARESGPRPVHHLIKTMRTVVAAKDPSARAARTGVNEIDTFTDEFNQMLAQIQADNAELRAALAAAELANRTKSEFLNNMSHELRTPLNAIIGFAEIIQKELVGPLGTDRYRLYANDIYESGHQLLALINDVLDISKVETKSFQLDEQETDLSDLIDQSIRQVRERADSAQLEFTVEIGPEVPNIIVDQRLLLQCLVNLLNNAVTFTPSQGRIVMRALNAADGFLLLSVTDTGVGIPESDLDRIMQPFAQVEGAHPHGQEGTGLGLPLVKAYMEAHGGTLELHSQVGTGTVAILCIPPQRLVQ